MGKRPGPSSSAGPNSSTNTASERARLPEATGERPGERGGCSYGLFRDPGKLDCNRFVGDGGLASSPSTGEKLRVANCADTKGFPSSTIPSSSKEEMEPPPRGVEKEETLKSISSRSVRASPIAVPSELEIPRTNRDVDDEIRPWGRVICFLPGKVSITLTLMLTLTLTWLYPRVIPRFTR